MTPQRQEELKDHLAQLLDQFQVEPGAIKVKPSINWVPILIQIVTLIGVMGFAYGALDGRLKLIEYRLSQIEKKVDSGTATAFDPSHYRPGEAIGP